MTTKLYVAYGSNLNLEGMWRRCPNAEPVGKATLSGYRLWFRSVADVVRIKGAKVPVGIWRITSECEEALDVYEGVAGGLYRKETVRFRDGREALIYRMNRRGIMPPTSGYLETIRQGYDDFKLDHTYLQAALEHSLDRKNPTAFNRWHHARRRAREEPRTE